MKYLKKSAVCLRLLAADLQYRRRSTVFGATIFSADLGGGPLSDRKLRSGRYQLRIDYKKQHP